MLPLGPVQVASLRLLFLLWLWQNLLLISPIAALSPNCQCVTFDDTYGKEYGQFTSPNWPAPYDDNIECILYRFVGKKDQVVMIQFEEFDVQRLKLECIYGDFLKLFLHLEEPSVNKKTPFHSIICGKIQDIEAKQYSNNNALVFEFHTDWRQGNNTGFRGIYKFINKGLFRTNGELIEGSKCEYVMRSTDQSNSSFPKRFYSPQYPSPYPTNVKCSYRFIGRENEKVEVLFEQVMLQPGDQSCYTNPDVIAIHNGKNASAPVIGILCNHQVLVGKKSTGPDLFVTFTSTSTFSGRGFMASYSFTEGSFNSTIDRLIGIQPAEKDLPKGNTACDLFITSNTSKNGTITSPNYPGTYPNNSYCNYHFLGEGKERVQIKFTDFELYLPTEENRDCESVDSVVVFITIKGQRERVDNFCGNKLPKQIMSNEHRMTVIFQSFTVPPNWSAKGFRAIYQFVTNFGIPSGRQSPQGECIFIYNSTEVSNGTFSTPNYPGVYPRDTECHYLFYGENNQKIHIHFAYFDVDGVPPCTSETASDYVEFSNFRTVDRKIPRHCGSLRPVKIESDADFFRVAFKSNDRFDGTGFEAFFQFRSVTDGTVIRRERISVQGSQEDVRLSCSLLLVLVLSSVLYQFVL